MSWETRYLDDPPPTLTSTASRPCAAAVAECHTLDDVPTFPRGVSIPRADDASGCPRFLPVECPCDRGAAPRGTHCAGQTCRAPLTLGVTCRQRAHGRADACCYALPRDCNLIHESME